MLRIWLELATATGAKLRMVVQVVPDASVNPQVPPVLENTPDIPPSAMELAVIPPEFEKVSVRFCVLPTATLPKAWGEV
jgi:hypothetical protein